jgi:hypothetical protein
MGWVATIAVSALLYAALPKPTVREAARAGEPANVTV